ncbi:hypothetical protein ALC56_06101, partial [Trachymyrmex septentrionalis]
RKVPADARGSTRDFTGRDRLYASDRSQMWPVSFSLDKRSRLRGYRYAGVSPGAVAAAYKQPGCSRSQETPSASKRRATKRCGAAARDRQRSAISTIGRRSKRRRLNRNSASYSIVLSIARERNRIPPWNKDYLPARLSPRDSRNPANARGRAAHSENGLDFYHVTERRRIPDMAKADDNRLHPWDVFMQL